MKYLYIVFAVLFFSKTSAQDGFSHVTLKGGFTYEKAFNFEIGYEVNQRYYNNWSLFFSGFTQNLDNGEKVNNWTFGLYYEPNLIEAKNNLLNLKIGSSLGTNENDFIIDGILGLEYSYAFSDNMKFTVFLKNNRMFNSNIKFRHALLVGFKHRL